MPKNNNPSDLTGTQALVPLSEAKGYRVAENNQDVRGWEVRGNDGEKIGKVNDLLIDTSIDKVRYLEVKVDRGLFGKDRNVLIPIGTARLADDEDVVLVDAGKDALREYPDYTGQQITSDYETSLQSRLSNAFRGTSGTATSGATVGSSGVMDDNDRFYDERGLFRGRESARMDDREVDRGVDRETDREARVTRSEEELAIGKRSVQAGEAYLRKTVETEHVRQEVPVTHEEVTVERRPLSADAATDVTITEDEIRVPLMEEEVVAQKRVVPKEEVVIRKRAVSDTEVVEEDLRRERVDVDDSGVRTQGSTTRERGKGAGQRLADMADDVKDRIDGNPASKPGPDPTDRR
jgi:uncharacterized protein (TIGR02271 family)